MGRDSSEDADKWDAESRIVYIQSFVIWTQTKRKEDKNDQEYSSM